MIFAECKFGIRIIVRYDTYYAIDRDIPTGKTCPIGHPVLQLKPYVTRMLLKKYRVLDEKSRLLCSSYEKHWKTLSNAFQSQRKSVLTFCSASPLMTKFFLRTGPYVPFGKTALSSIDLDNNAFNITAPVKFVFVKSMFANFQVTSVKLHWTKLAPKKLT